MATLSTAPPWSTMPLPQGWEAKYEPQVGRYFYINHVTRQTTWVDPRKTIFEAQQRSPAQARAYIPMQPIARPTGRTSNNAEVDDEVETSNSSKVAALQREIALMRAREQMEAEKQKQEQKTKLEKERERRRVQSAQRRQEAKPTPPVVETTFNEPPVDKEAVKREMKLMFANTQASVVDMILETYDFNKEEAKVALRQMGQKVVNQAPAKKPSPKSSPKKSVAKPTAKPTAKAPAKAPAKPVLTEMQKKIVKENLKRKFPHVNEFMIEMAVDSTHYDEEKSSAILRMLKTESSSSSTSGGAQGEGIITGQIEVTFPDTASTSSITTEQANSSKAVTFPETTPSTSSTTVTSSAAAAVPYTSDSQKRPTATAAEVSSPAKKPATPKVSSTSSPTRRPMAAKTAMPSKKKTTVPKKQTQSAPVGSKYSGPTLSSRDSGSTGARGPDPSLVKGPDISNLLQDYTQTMGPSPDNLCGANKENVIGPTEKTGRDPNLAMGPDRANCTGPEPGLAKGSVYNKTGYQESAIP